MTISRFFIAIVFSGLLLYACNKGNGNNNPSSDTFKKEMLLNYADTLIIPAYAEMRAALTTLERSADSFVTAPSVSTQAVLKQQFKNAYTSFEGISLLYFGPASALQLNNCLNAFPTNTSGIENSISSGTYDLTSAASDSIQGFAALDYLFFSTDAVSKFTGTTAINRKKYVGDVITRMKQMVDNTIGQWNGTYRTIFINSLKTDVGSSIGNLVNQFAFEMDGLKGPRIGWPFGKQSNGIVFADKCEAYYSGISRDLAVANIISLKKYYTGGAGRGIDDYLDLLGKQQLNDDVLTQFDVAISAIQAIPDPMSLAFTSSPAAVDAGYREVQKLLTLIKTDVASATAVQITYMDNDGD